MPAWQAYMTCGPALAAPGRRAPLAGSGQSHRQSRTGHALDHHGHRGTEAGLVRRPVPGHRPYYDRPVAEVVARRPLRPIARGRGVAGEPKMVKLLGSCREHQSLALLVELADERQKRAYDRLVASGNLAYGPVAAEHEPTGAEDIDSVVEEGAQVVPAGLGAALKWVKARDLGKDVAARRCA